MDLRERFAYSSEEERLAKLEKEEQEPIPIVVVVDENDEYSMTFASIRAIMSKSIVLSELKQFDARKKMAFIMKNFVMTCQDIETKARTQDTKGDEWSGLSA